MNKQQFLNQFHHIRQVTAEHDFPLKEAGRPASVLIPIVEYPDSLNVIFTVRAAHLKHHGGQISFPGGKQEPTDKNLLHTALRETYEEIGIFPEQVEIIGQLPLYRTISRYEVVPFIGFVQPPIQLLLDHNEVAQTFEVPLSYLLDQNNHLIHWVKRKNAHYPVYFIPWQDKNIWGATAAFIRNLTNHFYIE
ncbi:MAG: CoA pyrophosphatase [Paraglaciecola sp.]|uniref:CoA pyrophosphatase n=1 Tax=Pseudomonadati TaxID=3379134 RepID=UPI00273ECECD|nr:CoA pyrophosphatase [Paraglaciecola sp.]MDP5030569.1 CoA pyrophosphatase [Paraglaciecola sp.]MDP5040249.1 CoA pyrophosphatase [Paraglaciecola sp.]MDP5133877.1 CoA pyrophosphatase [Paraglaciecola sp.]